MRGIKAVALLSGGLDSSLAVKLIQDQGIEITCVNYFTSFCRCDGSKGCRKKAVVVSENLGVELKVFNVSEEYLDIVRKPAHGYGKNLNPCIDCRIFMFRKAKEFMNGTGASFIVTGEVLGQRPMSQNRRALEVVEKASGLEGFIVRPLSAKFFPASVPEKKGWIERGKFLDISGRSRKRQYGLTERLSVAGFGCPAGGCLLTDPAFSRIVRDLRDSDMLTAANVNLVKSGRYFSIGKSFKLVVGRNQRENLCLAALAEEGDLIIEPRGKGPSAIGRGIRDACNVDTAVKIVAYYCREKEAEIYFSVVPDEKKTVVIPAGLSETELNRYRVWRQGSK